MKKECIVCGEDFIGRSDKKFCSAYCRTTFYNKSNSDVSKYMRNVNNRLRRNRRILAKFNPEGKATVHRNALMDEGFKFDYVTNTYVTQSGKTYFFCYEQGYLPLDRGYYALVRKEAYVD